jgi:hypothetical protein
MTLPVPRVFEQQEQHFVFGSVAMATAPAFYPVPLPLKTDRKQQLKVLPQEVLAFPLWLQLYSYLRYRIKTTRMKRVALAQPDKGKPQPFDKPMSGD